MLYFINDKIALRLYLILKISTQIELFEFIITARLGELFGLCDVAPAILQSQIDINFFENANSLLFSSSPCATGHTIEIQLDPVTEECFGIISRRWV